jgi:aminobenzoyl-glutamate utilization protein B
MHQSPSIAPAGPALAQAPTTTAMPAAVPSPPPSAAVAADAVEAVREPILRISREVWATPELGLHEVRSAAVHVRELQAAGFRVRTGVSGYPTAFVAEWGQGAGGARIGFLPEYDALPGLGNAAEPRQGAAPGGGTNGHGCGHNSLGAGCTGAAIALKRAMEVDGTPGALRVYGCAAEETQGAKVFMARDGLFDDLDAALAWHPAPVAAAGLLSTAAADLIRVRFRGRSAHAGVAPWEGRSALKAAELFGAGVQFMREHVQPTARIHYIYESAGVAPNVVPDFAQVYMFVRERSRASVAALTDWTRRVAEGAAQMTETQAEFELFFGMWDLLPNEPLAALAHRHMLATPLDWTEEEQAFARAVQRAMRLPETGMAARVLPILGDIAAGGSTDVGDVSWNTPTLIFAWPSLPQGVGLHTWAVTACGGMSIGDRASLATARILAGAGYDLLRDAGLRAAARADFDRRRGGTRFVSPLPADRREPIGLPDFLAKTGEDEIASPLRARGGG